MAVPSAAELVDMIRAELELLDPDAAVERVRLGASLAELQLDSMTLMSMIAEVENRLGIRVPETALTELETVDQLVETIRSCAARSTHAGQAAEP